MGANWGGYHNLAVTTTETTQFTVDKTAPTFSSVYPASGETGAGRNTDIVARFSEKMDPATLTTSTVTLVKDGTTTPISAKVFYREDLNYNQVMLSPPYPEGFYLDANTKYTVKITGGTNGVKDLAGNQLGGSNQASGDYWWTFTTGDVPGPSATTTITAPTNLTATVGGTTKRPQVSLKWTDKSNNENNFVVERSEDNGTIWKVLTSSLAANATSYTDKTVVSGGKTYTYQVKATKGSDSSPIAIQYRQLRNKQVVGRLQEGRGVKAPALFMPPSFRERIFWDVGE